jgi:hypothetical protein
LFYSSIFNTIVGFAGRIWEEFTGRIFKKDMQEEFDGKI